MAILSCLEMSSISVKRYEFYFSKNGEGKVRDDALTGHPNLNLCFPVVHSVYILGCHNVSRCCVRRIAVSKASAPLRNARYM